MKKLYQSFESEAQNFQNTLIHYQEKFQGKFQNMLQKSEVKKQKIIEKLQSTKKQLQISIEANNPNKILKLQNKIDKLEIDMQKINRKDQIANDYHLVYDGLFNQLQITQNQNIETLSQAQRNDNYKILCSIKRQAVNLSNQVYKKKHIDPIRQICNHCNNLLNEYLKLGVDQQIQQDDIFQIDIVENQKFIEKKKLEEQKMLVKQEKIQKYFDEKDQQKQDKKNKIKNKYKTFEYYDQQQKKEQQNKDFRKQQQKQDQYDIDLIQQFDNLQIKDQNKQCEDIKQQNNFQNDVTAIEDSKLCQICFEFPKEYVATPCGHFVYCKNCKNLALKECLICREPVQLLIKVFQ
ncbi:unnamed protein product [Paramecium primaurelia]|uniref:RING-type domain-containing protein n=1 Tax=Paramecium primaurelia TaxID=5886 RepID=A0A8S1NXP5_PARPR|nr:unnamed protein product [Paramecium primaurelia]